ncbi:response regulator [Paenibacillus pasadenensis]|uniref:response regulator n=1 Tax=Paenibacillus TaxID=44249 RepID=UPI000413C4F5|nr:MULTISPECIES: response regulator [Paenibacillus]QGG58176.1 response regulator [Paenibacillus sp. B01]
MLKVAVVDDEEKIRLGLAKIIERTGPYEVVGVWASAREALSNLDASGAELLITDIRMPQMDGLQLIDELRERGSQIAVAVLSGYNDFAYAREALRGGVEDYLLKPVNQDELARLLERIAEKVGVSRSRQPLHAEALIELLLAADAKRIPEPVMQTACAQLDELGSIRGMYAFVVLHAAPMPDGERIAEALAALRREHRLLLREAGPPAVLLALRHGDHADTPRELAVTLLGRLPLSAEPRGGISGVHSGAAALARAYGEAEAALLQAWYAGSPAGTAVSAAASTPGRMPAAAQMPGAARPDEQELRAVLQAADLERAAAIAEEWLGAAEQRRLSWAELDAAAATLLGVLDDSLAGQPGPQPGSRPQPIRSRSWDAYAAALRQELQQRLALLGELKHQSRAVEAVKAYLQEHYADELDLQRLAELVHLTPSYLSKLFRSETGETITDYAISVRIEVAKRLLKDRPELKTYEVGERSGYADPAYFTKAFKRVTGKTPKEYRDSAR